MKNYIVLRDSPDWPDFDPETNRRFCLAKGLPETTVLDFIAAWNRVSRIDYRAFRDRLKQVALENFRAVKDATVVHRGEFRDIDVAPEDLVVFTDNDDWLAPRLFEFARQSANDDGAVWGSIRIGLIFSSSSRVAPDVYYERPFTSKRLYTNNYAVTGKALRRLGIDSLLEHVRALAGLERGDFRPLLVLEYLSCTVRHPACDAAAVEYMASESFRTDPGGAFAKTVDDMADIDPGALWTQAPLQAMTELIKAALSPAPARRRWPLATF